MKRIAGVETFADQAIRGRKPLASETLNRRLFQFPEPLKLRFFLRHLFK